MPRWYVITAHGVLVVKGKFVKTGNSRKILWKTLCANLSFPFYVFINGWVY